MRGVTVSFVFAAALAGCSGIPSVPYEEPGQSQNTARVRVITNSSVFGDSIVDSCAPSPRHKMAEAGRFGENGTPSINYPQFPLKAKSIDMPMRIYPQLIQYVGATRMAEGLYTEIATEYLVRTDKPFQAATLGAAVGSYGSTYRTCPAKEAVFNLSPGKDYDLVAGVTQAKTGNGDVKLVCIFGMFELKRLGDTPIAMPQLMTPGEVPKALCKK